MNLADHIIMPTMLGLRQMREGLVRHQVWRALAQEAVMDQHRRTTLGPLWLVINYLVYAGTFVVIVGHRSGIDNFGQYAATGLFVWLLISETLNQGVTLFQTEQSYIKGTTLPLFVYVLRLTLQLVIRSLYAAIGWIGVLLYTGMPSVHDMLLAVCGYIYLILLMPPAITLLALCGTFFPDMKFVIKNVVRAGIFLTPIFWVASEAGGIRKILYVYDPFTYLLEIMREPIMQGHVSTLTLQVCAAMFVITWAAASWALGCLHRKVVFAL